MKKVPIVVVESPYRGDSYDHLRRNIAYARLAMYNSIMREEAPFLGHLLYTQILDDTIDLHRHLGISRHLTFIRICDTLAVYSDLGISSGMRKAMEFAQEIGVKVSLRTIRNYDEALRKYMNEGIIDAGVFHGES